MKTPFPALYIPGLRPGVKNRSLTVYHVSVLEIFEASRSASIALTDSFGTIKTLVPMQLLASTPAKAAAIIDAQLSALLATENPPHKEAGVASGAKPSTSSTNSHA